MRAAVHRERLRNRLWAQKTGTERLADVLRRVAAENTMSGQNQSRAAAGCKSKPALRNKQPSHNGHLPKRKAARPRKATPKSGRLELGIEPLPKR